MGKYGASEQVAQQVSDPVAPLAVGVGVGAKLREPPGRAETRRWIKSLKLPKLPSFSTSQEFITAVEAHRERDIDLEFEPDLPTSACGITLVYPEYDRIVVDSALRGTLKDLAIMHETSHLLLKHICPGSGVLRGTGEQHYSSQSEWEAESLGTYFLALTFGLGRGAWLGRVSRQYAARAFHGRH